jgi:hypothetical protein
MPSPKHISLLIAAFAIQASLGEVSAAQGLETPVLDAPAQQVSAPDETRIASDLKTQYLFAGIAALGAGSGGDDQADSTAIRSSVRHGEVLEFRVTSVYYAETDGGTQREVDSIVSYQVDGDGWALLDVQMEGTRNVTPSDSGKATERC